MNYLNNIVVSRDKAQPEGVRLELNNATEPRLVVFNADQLIVDKTTPSMRFLGNQYMVLAAAPKYGEDVAKGTAPKRAARRR